MHSQMPVVVRLALENSEQKKQASRVQIETPPDKELYSQLDVVFVDQYEEQGDANEPLNFSSQKKDSVSQTDEQLENTSAERVTLWRKFCAGIMSSKIQYELCFTVFPVIAVVCYFFEC